MPFRPNYRFERAERDRQKKARKDEKLKRQQERASLRGEGDEPETGAEEAPPEP
jgi:hypothetical protein